MIDLHTHSTFSDGANTPEELVEMAHQIGLTAMALTDHDTVNGCVCLQEAAKKYSDLMAINGCELNVKHPADMEIIALNITDLQPYYERQKMLIKNREDICRDRLEKLNKLGYKISWEDVAFDENNQPRSTLAKPHIVNFLFATGQIESKEKAYKELLGTGGPAFVESNAPDVKETIDFIRQSGAVAVLAHPCLIKLKGDDLFNEIKWLKSIGLQGMEVEHSDMSPEDMAGFNQMAETLGLLKSGGSDFHGVNAHYGVELGVGRGQLNISHEYIEKILQASN